MSSRRSRRWIRGTAGITAAAAALQGVPARAAESSFFREHDYPVNVGLFMGFSFGHGFSFAYGGDVRFGEAGPTPFIRAEGRNGSYAKFTLGAVGVPRSDVDDRNVAPVGELGWSFLTASTGRGVGWSMGPHLGLGVGGLSGYMLANGVIPVVGDRSHYDVGVSFVNVQPQLLINALGSMAHGRPLRVEDGLALPELIAVDTLLSQRELSAESLALARAWGEDARAEAASVPAFERMAFELAALGAPVYLIEWALRAAEEEVRHTERCTRLASRWSGLAVDVAPIQATPRWTEASRAAFATIAREAWEDGCLAEGSAALAAQRALVGCRDPESRETQLAIAREEASHAELAWAVLDWVWRTGGIAARDAVVAAAEQWEAPAIMSARTDVDLEFVRAHGRASAEEEQLGAIEVQDRGSRRLRRLVRAGRSVAQA